MTEPTYYSGSVLNYAALNRQHIDESGITGPRRRACASKIHALIFTVIEDNDSSVFEMPNRDGLLKLAKDKATEMHKAGKFGFAGWFMSASILSWIVTTLFNWVFNWLIKQLEDWINANRTHSVAANRRGVLMDSQMQGYFAGARAVLQ